MRRFTVALTSNNNSGPFTIYYKEGSDYIMADLLNGDDATGITANQLSFGTDILISFTATEILVQNNKETCDNFSKITPLTRIFPEIPTIS